MYFILLCLPWYSVKRNTKGNIWLSQSIMIKHKHFFGRHLFTAFSLGNALMKRPLSVRALGTREGCTQDKLSRKSHFKADECNHVAMTKEIWQSRFSHCLRYVSSDDVEATLYQQTVKIIHLLCKTQSQL